MKTNWVKRNLNLSILCNTKSLLATKTEIIGKWQSEVRRRQEPGLAVAGFWESPVVTIREDSFATIKEIQRVFKKEKKYNMELVREDPFQKGRIHNEGYIRIFFCSGAHFSSQEFKTTILTILMCFINMLLNHFNFYHLISIELLYFFMWK